MIARLSARLPHTTTMTTTTTTPTTVMLLLFQISHRVLPPFLLGDGKFLIDAIVRVPQPVAGVPRGGIRIHPQHVPPKPRRVHFTLPLVLDGAKLLKGAFPAFELARTVFPVQFRLGFGLKLKALHHGVQLGAIETVQIVNHGDFDGLLLRFIVDVKDVQRYRWSDYGFHRDVPVALGFNEKALQIGKVTV